MWHTRFSHISRIKSIQVLMSELVNDPTGKVLKVKYIQKKSVGVCEIPYLFDQVFPTPP